VVFFRTWPTPSVGRARVAAAGAEIDPTAARLVAQRAGIDVKRLRADVERLLLYALGRRRLALTTSAR
jgi:putative heme degradation protein